MDEQRKIEEVAQYHNPSGLNIETTASFGQDITYWTAQAPDVLVLQLPEDDLLQGYFFTKLRKDVPPSQAIVVLCTSISSPLMQLSMQFSKLRMIKTPVEGFALYRAVNELIADYKVGQKQIHPRYLTEQVIEVLSDMHNLRMSGTMKNLSLSGAYFEASQLPFEMKTGDFVKLSILAGDPPKQYLFDAKVVWCKLQPAGSTGYGVTFVNKEDVYNHLLKNL
jgi:hypothetical protein